MTRYRAMLLTAALLIAVVLVGGLLARSLLFSSATLPVTKLSLREANVLKGINAARANVGLKALVIDPKLVILARHHSRWMLDHSYFEHDEPPQSYAARMYAGAGHRYHFNENIAWGTGNYGTAVYLVRSWMHSHYHMLNILDPNVRRIGVGIIVGNFEGNRGASMATTDSSS